MKVLDLSISRIFMKFSLYKHPLVVKGTLATKCFIVIKDDKGFIRYWTNFDKYVLGRSRVKKLGSYNPHRFQIVCKLLTYLFFDKHIIDKISQISIDHLKRFLNDYGKGLLDDDVESRKRQTVTNAVIYVLDFATELSREGIVNFKKEELYTIKETYNPKTGQIIKRKVPVFEIEFFDNSTTLLRDLPNAVFSILMSNIIDNHTNILMLVAAGAFAGLRPSEACNMRRSDSLLGPGITIETVNDRPVKATIDLTQELVLRSDLVNVGKIKKERRQKVYPMFLEAFCDCYDIYMRYIEGKKYEILYGPLTTNRDGLAITYGDYNYEFGKAVKEIIPALLDSNDAKLVSYGMLLQEKNISPHILRHWFSVMLTLNGEDLNTLMSWRGDTSNLSAITYLNNKGELVKEYEMVADETYDFMLWKATKMLCKK